MYLECNLCKSTNYEHLYLKRGYEIVKCKNCGLVFVKDPPDSSKLPEYYSEGYYTGELPYIYPDMKKYGKPLSYQNYMESKKSMISGFREKIEKINSIYSKKGKILVLYQKWWKFLRMGF